MEFKETIFAFCLVFLFATIFALYFGSLNLSGYESDQNTNIGGIIGMNQADLIDLNNSIQGLGATTFSDSNATISGTEKLSNDVFTSFVSGTQSFLCSLPLVSSACSAFGATGIIIALLQNTVTWSWFFIDKLFPTNSALWILGLAFKGIISLIQLVGIWWLVTTILSALQGGK